MTFEERVPLTRISSGLVSPSRWNIGGKSNLLKLKQDWRKKPRQNTYMNQSHLKREGKIKMCELHTSCDLY